jgi:Domain of unknown function (DUF222)
MGYVTGEVTATDAAAIDAMLAATARSLGGQDPRTERQRRADLFADLLLGRLGYDQPDNNDSDQDGESDDADGESGSQSEGDSEGSDAESGADSEGGSKAGSGS